ncbi:MAG: tripartite tricarboxylate transporter TctB family protein [Lawsonibacter sp.]
MKKGNLIVGGLCVLLAVVVIGVSSTYPTSAAYGTGVPGPGLWPTVISLLLLVCSGILIFRALFKMKPEENVSLNLLSAGPCRVYLTILILLVYVLVLKPVGFIISTTVMEFVFIQWFGKKKPYITLLISLAITLVSYFAFKYLLNVPIDFGFFAI